MRARLFRSALLLPLALASPAGAEPDSPPVAAVETRPSALHASDEVQLVIDVPPRGARVESEMHMAEVRGSAIAPGERPSAYDVMIVLDVSQSTKAASGADVDGDGEIGENPRLGLYAAGEFPDDVWTTDPEDTILHAEIAAARALTDTLDARRTRVGLIQFSGQVDPKTSMRASREQRDAELLVPLTDDFRRVHAALDRLAATAPHGATNFAAGIRLATTELAGFSGAASESRAGAKKIVLFLTDGIPSFPVGRADVSDPGDLEAAVAAARVAKTAGIRINTYALGPDALTKPLAATQVASATLGTFTPVLEPGAIVAALQAVSFANIEDVGIVNLTTGEVASDVQLNPDGSFSAFAPVREGANRVLVKAVASDGSEANVELDFDFAVHVNLDDRMRQRELARIKRINDELIRHMEAERVKRARLQKKMERELDIRAIKPE